jgi:hypothetical protein
MILSVTVGCDWPTCQERIAVDDEDNLADEGWRLGWSRQAQHKHLCPVHAAHGFEQLHRVVLELAQLEGLTL